jgi:hypothetical protein
MSKRANYKLLALSAKGWLVKSPSYKHSSRPLYLWSESLLEADTKIYNYDVSVTSSQTDRNSAVHNHQYTMIINM